MATGEIAMQQYPPNMNVGRATRWLERSTGLDLFSLAPRHWRVLWTLFRERELTPFGESLELDELNTTGIAETYLYNIARTGLVDRRGIRDPKDNAVSSSTGTLCRRPWPAPFVAGSSGDDEIAKRRPGLLALFNTLPYK